METNHESAIMPVTADSRPAWWNGCMPQAKAAGFNSFHRVLRSKLSDSAFEGYLAALPVPTRMLVTQPPSAVDWISSVHLQNAFRTLQAGAFLDHPEQFCEVGKSQINHDMNSLYRLFARFTNPNKVINKAAM